MIHESRVCNTSFIQAALDLPVSQVMGLFNRIVRKFSQFLKALKEEAVAMTMPDVAAAVGDDSETHAMMSSDTLNKELVCVCVCGGGGYCAL